MPKPETNPYRNGIGPTLEHGVLRHLYGMDDAGVETIRELLEHAWDRGYASAPTDPIRLIRARS